MNRLKDIDKLWMNKRKILCCPCGKEIVEEKKVHERKPWALYWTRIRFMRNVCGKLESGEKVELRNETDFGTYVICDNCERMLGVRGGLGVIFYKVRRE